jgi:hypothetical protein
MAGIERRTNPTMPVEPGFRTRQEIEALHWRGRRRARRPMPQGKSLLLTGVVVLVLVSAGLLAVMSLWDSMRGGGADGSGKPAASSPPGRQDSKDPFAGTPAEKYAEGDSGVQLPVAAAIGPWTAPQVQDVLVRAKQTLVAARLDPAMVEQSDPAAYLATISEGARGTVSKSLQSADALGYVSRLATGYQLSAPIRVKGTMTVTLGPKKELVIGADYVWIYPLVGSVPAETGGPGSSLVVLHTVETYQWFSPKGIAQKDTGLRPGAGQIAKLNLDCTQARTGLLALPSADTGDAPTAPASKAFDPATRPDELPSPC